MDSGNIKLGATARIKLTKLDEHGNVLSTEEKEIELTGEEAAALWHSQQQE